MSTQVTLIPGDGIGPEVVNAAVEAIEAAGAKLSWERVAAGAGAVPTHGTPIPAMTLESIRRNKLALKGPLATPIGEGFRSVNVALRKEFGLYANVRPARSFAGVETRYTGVDLITIRENTEGLYSGVEHYVDEEHSAAESISIVTRKGSERIVEYAFEYAKENRRRKITLVHKANILKATSGLFLETGRAIALKHPEIEFKEMIVDNCAMQLVKNPLQFDVIVTTNLFGDILSDLTSGLIGGLGLTAGANVGKNAGIFEAVHGTAPDIAGKGMANPTAVMLAGVMLLEHIGERTAADRLVTAVREAIASKEAVTPDLGGSATTRMFTQAVLKRLK
ncbi:MAG TPA: isocitrate/isopropylmalate family dehydrogenase [Myxococcales bacterium]|jgi:isocitrate dehydrogenase (NAD+)|nr:isocitrate/isopropylmalate family dehydrogenase [Myxococcales bacterium]